jgi:hypothetical protein
MRSSYHQVDDVVVLTIAGAIDTHAAAVEFEYLLAHVPGAGHLVLDLTEVTALGTTGLTVLARAAPGDEHVVIGERHDVVLRAGGVRAHAGPCTAVRQPGARPRCAPVVTGRVHEPARGAASLACRCARHAAVRTLIRPVRGPGDTPGMTASTTKIERSAPAIRAVLAQVSPEECAQFEAGFAEGLARASAEFDLAPAEAVLDRWWGIAAIRVNPLSEQEAAQVAAARGGDFTGLRARDEHGNWVQL